ncbi:hypothetical protein Tco_1255958 [Tanacetum coccineum]
MAKAVIKFDKGTITLRSGKSKISFHRIPESLGKDEKWIKNDIEPIAPTMTVNRLVLEWEERIKLHQDKEMEFDQWRSQNFKNKHLPLVEVKGEKNKEEVTLYLMRRSLEVLKKFHWMILGGRFNQLSHVSSPLLSKPGEYQFLLLVFFSFYSFLRISAIALLVSSPTLFSPSEQLQPPSLAYTTLQQLGKIKGFSNGKTVDHVAETSTGMVLVYPEAYGEHVSMRELELSDEDGTSTTFKDFDNGLHSELNEVKTVFIKMEAAVEQCLIDNKYFDIQKKELSLDNDRLLDHIIYQDVINIVMHVDYVHVNMKSSTSASRSQPLGVIPNTSVSRPQLKSNHLEDRVMSNNSQGKKQEVEDHRRKFKFSNNKTSVTACNDSLNAKTSNVNFVCVTCGKCVLNDNHDLCVLHYINGVNSRTRQPMAVPVRTTEPKHDVNKSVATSSKKTVATDSTVKKSRNITRKLYEQVSKTCSWWYPKYTPSGYKWKPKSEKGNVNPNVSMPLGNASRTANILEHKTPRCSTVSNTPLSSNSFAARRDNSIHRRL